MANLLDEVVGVIRGMVGGGVRVCVNATAGFNAETSFLVIAAALAGATSAYHIHESFREIAELPLLSVTLDPRVGGWRWQSVMMYA